MPQLGVPELVLILVIVIAVFGAGKLANLGGALGKGVHDFRKSIRDEDAKKSEIAAATEAVRNAPPAAPQAEVQAAVEPVAPPSNQGDTSA